MIIKKYRSELISILNLVEGIYTLEFKSLNGKFKYYPGQFLHLAIDTNYDGSGQWPESRCFSMQSNPNEGTLKITYAVKGRFTKQMEEILRIGSNVWLKLPYGDLFMIPHNKVNTVFIAGGTGITPFLSLFTHESFKEYINPSIYLGFRSKTYNIYKKELSSIQLNKNDMERCIIKESYDDADGQLNINQIFIGSSPISDYFISGPTEMIKVFKNYLIKNKVRLDQIKTDDWE